MDQFWIAVCPITDAVRGCRSLAEVTDWAIGHNRRHPGRPAARLYRYDGAAASYVGRLWRAAGEDFDPDDCWK